MINFLAIYIASESNTAETAAENIYKFIANLLDTDVFSKTNDRFVLYLEDLYQTEHHQTAKQIDAYLNLTLAFLGVEKFEIRTNSLQNIIVEHCKTTYPSIENHLNFALNFSRAIMAPILVKELFEQFGLHYETITTGCTTVYHDLDMRYTVQAEDQKKFPNIYAQAQNCSLAKLRNYSQGFDVFWALNAFGMHNQNLFLNAFYWTLISIIEYSTEKLFLDSFPAPKQFSMASGSFRYPKVQEHYEFNKILKSYVMTKGILILHCGYSKVQNLIPSMIGNAICRNRFCGPIITPYRPFPIPFLLTSSKFIPRAGITAYLSMPCYNSVYTAQKEDMLLPDFVYSNEIYLEPSFWTGTEFKASPDSDLAWSYYEEHSTFLKKSIYGQWQQIPLVNEHDISHIIRKYPFMAYIFVLTKGLRAFAQLDGRGRAEKRTIHRIQDDSWVWQLFCQQCQKHFLPFLQETTPGFTFCVQCMEVFCNTCRPSLPSLADQEQVSWGFVCTKCAHSITSLPTHR